MNPIINAVAADRYEAALAEAKEVDTLIAAGLSDEEWQQKPFLGTKSNEYSKMGQRLSSRESMFLHIHI